MASENHILQENPWDNLCTVTSFNQGNNLHSTQCIGKSRKNKTLRKISSSNILLSSLINQLCTILETDPIQSKKLYFCLCDTMHKLKLIDHSYKLGEFELIQGRYKDALYRLIDVARTTIGSENTISISRPLPTYVSSYKDQFHETGFIASGGFGNVFKAVHKLDEVEYAIKKIVVRSVRIKTIMSHLQEVKTLAKLNHTNIVSYKQAWIEPMSNFYGTELSFNNNLNRNQNIFESRIDCSADSSLSEQKSQIHKNYKNEKSLKFSSNFNDKIKNKKKLRSDSNSDILFKENAIYDICTENDACNNITEINSITSTEESISSDESLEDQRICQYSTQTNQYAILYIQMALCEKTLRQWLDERTETTPISTVAAIATQILCGLNYIHSLNIVHHDIKPSNIFILTSGKLQIQLGDFGLACPLQRDSHDVIIGTCMYAAPEQLKGECNPKSDIYSLGIVLLELLIPMRTSMECIKIIETLKTGKIPSILTTSHPIWVNIISQLIQKNPIKRPSTDKLLEDLKINKDLTISKLQDENYKLKNENDLLQNENKIKDKIIENQKIMIEELQAKLAKFKSET